MKNQIHGLVASLLTLALTACGGGGGGNSNGGVINTGGVSPPSIMEENPIQLQDLLTQANSSENLVSSLEITDTSLHSTTPQTVSIQGGNRQFVFVVNGKSYTLPRTDGRLARGADTALTRSNFVARRQSYADSVLDSDVPNSYILFNYAVYDETTTRTSLGFFVTGLQTPPTSIPATASATYNGRVLVSAVTFDSPVRSLLLAGNLRMNVDFAGRRISGNVTNIIDINGDYAVPSSAGITFNEGIFASDGSYNGRLTLNNDFINALGVVNLTRGTYQGETYGRTASGLAGILDAAGLNTDGDQFRASGGFYADR